MTYIQKEKKRTNRTGSLGSLGLRAEKAGFYREKLAAAG